MEIYLIGYPGSQRILPVTKYLTKKYLPRFGITHCNYDGPIEGWSRNLVDKFESIEDELVILALDDYLVANRMDWAVYSDLYDKVQGDVVLAKLCECTDQENEEYPVTTQYTLWNREYLISLLKQTTTPWDFEVNGSKIFKGSGKKAVFGPALKYFTNSSLSSRWEGVRLDGLNEEDIQEAQKLL